MIEILSVNQLEHKDKKIYKDQLTVLEVAKAVYEGLLSDDYDSSNISEMLTTLYQTKDINSPYFFSFSFTVGVFLPLLSPIVFPPLITLFGYLKLKVLGKKPKEKIKSD